MFVGLVVNQVGCISVIISVLQNGFILLLVQGDVGIQCVGIEVFLLFFDFDYKCLVCSGMLMLVVGSVIEIMLDDYGVDGKLFISDDNVSFMCLCLQFVGSFIDV